MNILELFFIILGISGFGFWFLSVFTSLGRGPVKLTLTHPISFFDAHFMAAMEGVSRANFLPGGLPVPLHNGDGFFSSLFEEIKKAKKSIHIAVFIFRSQDSIGKELLELLIHKAKEGIEVRLLLDSRGSDKFTAKAQQELEQAGGAVYFFRPFKFGILTQYHRRNHCRAFIIDGKIGYLGGSAIGQEWTGNAQDPSHWRDTMFKVEGAQARALQDTFATLLTSTSGQVLSGSGIYPDIAKPLHDSMFLNVLSSPALQANLLRDIFWLSCMAARESIYVQNSYFFPTRQMRQAFIQKAREGIQVVLMLPSANTDEKIVYYGGKFFYGQLLLAGVKIYEYQSTMLHSKNFIADDYWSVIGSANMDVRSHELNEENIMGILSKEFGKTMRQQFDADLQHCQEVTLESWHRRSWQSRFLECICVLVGHQL